MALQQTSNLPSMLTSKDCIPARTRVKGRCISEKFGDSKKGNKMITREWEVVAPEVISLNGVNKALAGTKLIQYCTLESYNEDGSVSATSPGLLARFRDEQIALQLPDVNGSVSPTDYQIDPVAPLLNCSGVIAELNIGSEEFEYRNPATPEDLAARRKFGSVKMGADGKPEKGYRPRLEQVLCRAAE